MKIKTKKQMNLPQLIEWAWDNGIKNKRYKYSDSIPYDYVWINENSDVQLDDNMCISKTDTFTVEVEEEITEDTVLYGLVKYKWLGHGAFGFERCLRGAASINNYKDDDTHAFYIQNEDMTMTLIWTKDKGLVA